MLEEEVPSDVDSNGVKDGVKYDTTQKWIKVTVEDAGNGTLTVTKDPVAADGGDGTWTNEQLGALKFTKAVTVNGEAIAGDATDTQKQLADGTYTFTVQSGTGIDPAVTKYVQITVTNGVAASYKVADINTDEAWTAAESTTGEWATITDLAEGDYTITETAPTNGTALSGIKRGDAKDDGTYEGDSPVSMVDKKVTVRVTAGDTAAEQTSAQATFTNNKETTELNVSKVWDSTSPSDHPTSVTFKVYRVGYYMDGEDQKPASEGFYPNDETVYTINGSAVTKVSDLPVNGVETVDEQARIVTYTYRVVEQPVKGDVVYWPSYTIDGTSTIIKNTPVGDTDHETEVSVSKVWLDEDGKDASAAHEKDQIEFTLKQVPHATGYVPVTLLYVNADNTLWKQEEIFVKSGSTLSFTFEKGTTLASHHVGVTIGNSAISNVGGRNEKYYYTTPKITDATKITLKLDFSFFGNYDFWGDRVINLGTAYQWTSSVTASSGTLYEDYNTFKTNMLKVDPGKANEGIYTLSKSTLTKSSGTYDGTITGDWAAKFEKLPELQKVGDDYVIFTYEISELKIKLDGGTDQPVGETQVDGYQGETTDYLVQLSENNGMWTITNREKPTVEVEVEKKWVDSNGEKMDPPEGAKITLSVYSGKTEEEATAASNIAVKTVELDGTTDENGEAKKWVATFKDLPKFTDDGTTELVYIVKETSGQSGYEVLYSEDGKATYSKKGEGENAEYSDITNKLSTVDLHILKVKDDGTTPLTGASFTLKQYKDDTYREVEKTWDKQAVSTDEGKEGTLTFTGLAAGYYELEETDSPDGYVKATANPRFQVKLENGKYTVELDSGAKDVTVSYDKATTDATEGTIPKLTVVNHAGIALPQTGGIGTHLFTILGSILTLTSGVVLTLRKRKQTA